MRLVPKVALAVAIVMAVLVPAALARAGKVNGQGSASSVAGWVYIDADNAAPNKNAVLAIPYSKTGIPLTKQSTQFPTGGTGTPYVTPLPNAVGTATGDHQVLLSSNKKLLFAVNQGSNSIAVFHVNSHTGALTGLKDFYSGGLAPVALGYAHGVLVVANHGIIAPFNPLGPSPPGPSDLVSFAVSPGGHLSEVNTTAPDPDGLLDATFAPDGSEIVTTGFFPEVVSGAAFPTFGPQLIRSVNVSSGGTLNQLQAFSFPSSFTAGLTLPAFIPPVLYPLPFGVAFNPTPGSPYVYVNAAVAGKLAVYNYSNPSNLTLVSSTDNLGPGGSPTAACWIVISNNGKFLYDSNSVTQNVSVFALSNGGANATLLEQVPLKSTGTNDALSLDPSGKWLYVIGEHDDIDAPRPEGIHPDGSISPAPLKHNYLDAYKVNQTTGDLTEIATDAIPVPTVNLPYGVATLGKS
jgi:hypothetical protein